MRIQRALEEDLFPYQEAVFDRVVKEMQTWWAAVLVFKRCRRIQNQLDRSQRRFRTRQMRLMKREVDELIRLPLAIDKPRFLYKYAFISQAVREYIDFSEADKARRMFQIASRFRDNLWRSVCLTRVRWAEEQERLRNRKIEDVTVIKPIVIKKSFAREERVGRWICYRAECKLRKFLTAERYAIHQNVHNRDDLLRYKKYEKDKNAQFSRAASEAVFLRQLRESREYMATHEPSVSSVEHETNLALQHFFFDRSTDEGSDRPREVTRSHPFMRIINADSSSAAADDKFDESSLASFEDTTIATEAEEGGESSKLASTTVSLSSPAFPSSSSRYSLSPTLLPARPREALMAQQRSMLQEALSSFSSLPSLSTHSRSVLEGTSTTNPKNKSFSSSSSVSSSSSPWVPSSTRDNADERMEQSASLSKFHRSLDDATEFTSSSVASSVSPRSAVDSQTVASSFNRRLWSIESDEVVDILEDFSMRSHSLGSSITLLRPTSPLDDVTTASSVTRQTDAMLSHESSCHHWSQFPHVHLLNANFNAALYSLELVSKQGDVTHVSSCLALDRPVIRIGTHSSCECKIVCRGAAQREGKIKGVHCLLFTPMDAMDGGKSLRDKDSLSQNSGLSVEKVSNAENPVSGNRVAVVGSDNANQLRIVDNHSVWGTYAVSADGTKKVPHKISAGVLLTPGMLICIGVTPDGPQLLPPTDANKACVVFRVRCVG